MASSQQVLGNEENQTCVLTEDDIPGAKLPCQFVEQCSVMQLRRWLLCRGAKTTGLKSVLVTR